VSTDRSDKAYEHWLDAAQKFDYFVTGVCLALVGYLASTLHPSRIGFDSQTLELASVIAILAAAFCGLKRIEATVTALGAAQRRLYREESAGSLAAAASKGDVLLNQSTGEVLTADDALARAQVHRSAVPVVKSAQDQSASASEQWYDWRNRLLIGGLFALVAARVWGAYVP
jgi:hypothetical protein